MLAASLVVANVLAVSMVQLTGRALPVCHRTPRLRAGILVACDGEGEEAVEDLNWLQTRLQVALAHEDYAEAATIRDRIRRQAGATSGTAGEAAWATLGVPDWLADRLERLDFQLPTRVQMHALRATESGDDAAVCAPTGSGKTLAYLLPLLAALSDDLLSEDLSGFLGSFLDGGRPASGGYAKRAARRRSLAGSADDGESSLEAMRVPTPAILIVVPTRELGVQVSMIAYRLLGGGATNPTLQPYTHPSRFQPGGKANMFSYSGPRHVKVFGLWDEQALYAATYQDMLKGVHIIVGTPEYVSRVAVGGKLPLHHLRGIVVDEADACFADTPSGADAPADGPAERTTNADAMAGLLRRMRETRESAPGGGGAVPPPQTILAGASLTPALVQRALRYGWVREPALVSERGWIDNGAQLEAIASFDEGVARGGGRGGGLAAGGVSGAAAGWTEQRVPAGHSHRYVVVKPSDAVAVLCRLLRARFEAANSETEPPRVVVFAPSAEAAVRLASQLQGALFGTLSGDASAGLWGLSVLLPSAEARLDTTTSGDDDDTLSVLESSLRVMEMFACNRTSVLVTTAAATRGLDFPQVTDVLNLGIVGSAADYVHRAGRVGRVGQLSRGIVTSVLTAAEVPELHQLGEVLQFTPAKVDPPPPTALEGDLSQADAVQVLSDTYNLYEAADEPPDERSP